MSSIKIANKLYRDGFYEEALSAYEDLAKDPLTGRLLRTNIRLCNQKLGLNPKLSIIVPVYNSGKYLERCLTSIVNQSEPSIEIIIINDGSNDNSVEIIEQFAEKDGRIVFINNSVPSGNPGTPRNQGILLASGKYIGFVDSDDWIDINYFSSLSGN